MSNNRKWNGKLGMQGQSYFGYHGHIVWEKMFSGMQPLRFDCEAKKVLKIHLWTPVMMENAVPN